MRRILGLGVERRADRRFDVRIRDRARRTDARLIQQAGQPLPQKAAAPFPDGRDYDPELGDDGRIVGAVLAARMMRARRAVACAVRRRRIHCCSVARSSSVNTTGGSFAEGIASPGYRGHAYPAISVAANF
jgi:hypothetical protein